VLERAAGYLNTVVEHLRILARELRPMMLQDLGLAASLTSLAAGKEASGCWRGAAIFRQLAGRVAWGQTGRLYRRYAAALRRVARGQTEEALLALDQLAMQPMPLMICGVVRVWKLSLLVTLRQWDRAVAFYETTYDWGTLGQATQARLFAAGCLTTATDSPALCAGVPPESEIMRGAQWTVEQCRKRGVADQQGCTQIFQEVEQHCRRAPSH